MVDDVVNGKGERFEGGGRGISMALGPVSAKRSGALHLPPIHHLLTLSRGTPRAPFSLRALQVYYEMLIS